MFIPFPAMPLNVASLYDPAHALEAKAQRLAGRTNSQPARVVGSLALLIGVLRDIAARPPESLSAAEADVQALFDDQIEDLLAIFDRAKEEMIAETATAARAGVM